MSHLTPGDSKPRYVIADENHQWTHILADDGRDTPVLFVFDTLKNRLIDAMIQVEGKSWRWRYATTGELENLTGHLVNANQDALENPEVYGLLLRNSIPEWARHSTITTSGKPVLDPGPMDGPSF